VSSGGFGGATVREALDSAVIAIAAAGSASPRLDAELLLADALGIDRAALRTDVPFTVAGIVTLLEETKPGMRLLTL
jgi:release factor glutamine methyltransferase